MIGFLSPKNILRLVLLLAVIVAFFWIKPREKDVVHETISHTMVMQQMEELGKLELTKYSISDMMHYEKYRTWLPNSHTSIMIVGEVIACVDLRLITEDDVFISGDSINIILPDPEICSFKIDHSRSKTFDVKYGFWETHKLVDAAYKDAEKQIYEQALSMGIATEAKASAQKTLVPFLKLMGFKTVRINFKGQTFVKMPDRRG